jgi:hypothetical protein
MMEAPSGERTGPNPREEEKMSNINNYRTGKETGKLELSADQLATYKAKAQWPQGVIEAGDILTPSQLAELGVSSEEVIWVD